MTRPTYYTNEQSGYAGYVLLWLSGVFAATAVYYFFAADNWPIPLGLAILSVIATPVSYRMINR